MAARTELSSFGLPLKDLDCFEKTAKVLRKNISFEWKGPQDWVGLTKADLTELTLQIAAFIGITRKQAKKITIIFGDHHSFLHRDLPYSAVCQPYIRQGFYSDITVVLNRSLEVALEIVKQDEANQEEEKARLEELGLYDTEFDDAYICELSPFESVVWSIAEELKHAQINLIAGSLQKSDAWSKRYLDVLKKKGVKLNHIYDIDLDEVAANRLVLRVLTYLATDEKEKQFFRQCYLTSLRSWRVFFTSFTKAAYVSTGYKVSTQSKLKNVLTALSGRKFY